MDCGTLLAEPGRVSARPAGTPRGSGPARAGPGLPDVDVHRDREVALGGDHPGVGEQPRRPGRTPRCRSWRSPGGRGRRPAARRCPMVTTPRSIAAQRGGLRSPMSRCASAGTSTSTDVDQRGAPPCARPGPRRSRWPSPSVRPRIVPWPIMCGRAPRCRLRSAVTCPKYAGKPRSWSMPRPSEAAASARSVRAQPLGLGDEGGVAGVGHGRPQRDLAQPAGRVVVVVGEGLAVDHDAGGARHRRLRGQPGAQQGQAADGLEGRAGRRLAVGRDVDAAGARAVRGATTMSPVDGPDRHQRRGRPDVGEEPLGRQLELAGPGWSAAAPRRVASTRKSSRSLPSASTASTTTPGGAGELLVVPRLQPGQAGDVADLGSGPGSSSIISAVTSPTRPRIGAAKSGVGASGISSSIARAPWIEP